MELLMNPAFLALIGTIFGGIGLKTVEHLLNKSKTQEDIAAVIRKELREDVTSLRAEIKRVETEADLWRGKYYEVIEELSVLKARMAEYEKHQATLHPEKKEESLHTENVMDR